MRRFRAKTIYSGDFVDQTPVELSGLVVNTTGRLGLPEVGSQASSSDIELPGVVVPGFIDTHAHLRSLGGGPRDLDLREAEGPDDLLAAVAGAAETLPDGAWISGTGWNDGRWTRPLPTPADLDAAAKGRPVALFRRDRHALLASLAALDKAALAATDPNPEGGVIGRTASGGLSGLLIDTAMDHVTDRIPEPTVSEMVDEVSQKMRFLASLGVTCVHEAWVDDVLWVALDQIVRGGAASVRVRAMLGRGFDAPPVSTDLDWLRPIAVKGFADGSLGSRGAQLSRSYCDEDTCGIAVESDADLFEKLERARAWGLQAAVHAIGDRAVTRVLDLYQQMASREDLDLASFAARYRWRIEHAQMVRPQDVPRLKSLCLAVQPIHFWADAPWATARLGESRLRWSHRIASLIEPGAAFIGFGSDFPIESGDPRRGMAAAVCDRHAGAPNWSRASERIDMKSALSRYWQSAAYLAFDEGELGRLAPGYLADFVCLDADPFGVDDITSVSILATYVGGRCVYSADPNGIQFHDVCLQ